MKLKSIKFSDRGTYRNTLAIPKKKRSYYSKEAVGLVSKFYGIPKICVHKEDYISFLKDKGITDIPLVCDDVVKLIEKMFLK